MNRLILIGNGFDLAHGLPTCYKDFIIWYIKDCFEKAHDDKSYEDPLIAITATDYNYHYHYQPQHRVEWIDDYLSKFEHPKRRKPVMIVGWGDENRHIDRSPFQIKYKSNLIEPLLGSCSISNWVDIESEYYELLKEVLELKNEDDRRTQLIDLNKSLSFIISRLELYLSKLEPSPFLKGYEDIFSSMINGADLYPKSTDKFIIPAQTQILNFNYTDTPKKYIDKLGDSSPSATLILNYIHGKLKDFDNELIFGFGDEIDSAYKKMEDDSKVKGYFDYIKSFWYLRTDNYRSLVNFLDLDDYQVYVLGHSCGLSDRTMLQMIFENERCRSIKIYYYEDKDNENDNFVSLTHEIARHFTYKGVMRKKILSKKRSERMPQYND